MDKIWYIVYILSIVLFLPSLVLGWIAQSKTVSTFDKYSKYRSVCGVKAQELALVLLANAGVTDVKIVEINGKLTDCYDSKNKILKLSSSTINSTSMAALGVCAHEVGHAIQDNQKMFTFRLRNAIVPVMSLFSKAFFPLMIIGSLLSFTFYLPQIGIYILWGSVISYGLSFIFYLVTLPLEYDASRRAGEILAKCEFFTPEEVQASKKVLNAAIWTYVSALTTSMLYFLRFLSLAQILSKDRR